MASSSAQARKTETPTWRRRREDARAQLARPSKPPGWITDEVGADHVGRIFVRGSQASLAGGIAGVLAGFAVATVNIRAAVYGAGAVTAAMGVVALAFMPETGFVPEPRGERSPKPCHARHGGERLPSGAPRPDAAPARHRHCVHRRPPAKGFDRLREAHLLRNVGVPSFVGFDPLWWFAVLSIGGTLLWLPGLGRTLVFPTMRRG